VLAVHLLHRNTVVAAGKAAKVKTVAAAGGHLAASPAAARHHGCPRSGCHFAPCSALPQRPFAIRLLCCPPPSCAGCPAWRPPSGALWQSSHTRELRCLPHSALTTRGASWN
jgi:hypothetical protein